MTSQVMEYEHQQGFHRLLKGKTSAWCADNNVVNKTGSTGLNLSSTLIVLDEIVLVQHGESAVDLGASHKAATEQLGQNPLCALRKPLFFWSLPVSQFISIHFKASSPRKLFNNSNSNSLPLHLFISSAKLPSPHVSAPANDPLRPHPVRCRRAWEPSSFGPQLTRPRQTYADLQKQRSTSQRGPNVEVGVTQPVHRILHNFCHFPKISNHDTMYLWQRKSNGHQFLFTQSCRVWMVPSTNSALTMSGRMLSTSSQISEDLNRPTQLRWPVTRWAAADSSRTDSTWRQWTWIFDQESINVK